MKKSCALVLFSAAVLCAADFKTNQAARGELGQENFTRQEPGASERLLGAVSGVAYANDTLFVVDSNRVNALPQNNRVLVFTGVSGLLPPFTASIDPEGARCPVCGGAASAVLGQPNFTYGGINGTKRTDTAGNPAGDVHDISSQGFRTPTAVATDGQKLAVADTDNNRVLIWNRIPTDTNTAADVVVGQGDFNTNTLNFGGDARTPSAKGLKGPQAVWIDSAGRFYVADTQNHRVLIWNRVPTSNGQAADLVLGQANFTSYVEPDIAQTKVEATAQKMLNPVSVTTDPQGRLYVTDLGHNRVLVWNALPSANYAAADIALGQPDMTSSDANNAKSLCDATGTNDKGENTYPARCSATLEFPRFALSDGKRLFIADGGNDRVLVYNQIPTTSGQRADAVLGQKTEFDIYNSETDILGNASELNPDMVGTNALRTPMSLAWDGSNLFVSDPFNRRVMVFTPAEPLISDTGVRNAASIQIYAVGTIAFSGTIQENDEATVKIADKEYKYKVTKDDSIGNIIRQFVGLINADAGDPNAFATPNTAFNTLVLTARKPGDEGNAVTYTVSVAGPSTDKAATLVLTAASSTLQGGQNAAKIAPGTLVTINGEHFSDQTVSAPVSPTAKLPYTLGGVEVYFDGIRAPLLFVSPTQIKAQMPYLVSDATSSTAWVRSVDAGGNVRSVSIPVAVPIVIQNPGIFAQEGSSDPRPAMMYHESSYATGAISVDGTIKENDVATVKIEDRSYSYTVKAGDTLTVIRDALVQAINEDPRVRAEPSGQYTRIRLFAREAGEAGRGIPYSTNVADGASVILTPFGTETCCSNEAGAPVTEDNPAVPGETLYIYATGLGLISPDEWNVAGQPYNGPEFNQTNSPVSDAIAGGKTANIFFAGLAPQQVGVYKVVLQLNSDLPTNPQTQLTIAQDIYVSNIVTFPLRNPNDQQ